MNPAAPSVEVRNLTVSFGDFKAVDDVSFEVQPGEIFGFLGANGAGKTTTIRVLCGLLRPTLGQVKVAGLDPKDGLSAVKARVGYMSQKFTLYQDLSVIENLEFTAALRKMPKDLFKSRLEEILAFIGFDRDRKTLVQDLPGGLKQEVSLAAAILPDPAVLFLDEPTSGVTPAARARFWALIRNLSAKGKTVFVTTHYMDEAEQCGRIALMRTGQIIALDTPEGLKRAAFPESMVELTLAPDRPHSLSNQAEKALLDRLRNEGGLLEMKPHGMRFHALVGSREVWDRCLQNAGHDFSARPIQPSLEDVFIRLVEGKSR
jgi:ABC-2 type transport system ATP-binding protein